MPRFSAFFLFFAMASLGLPGLNNFVGELLVLLGTYRVAIRRRQWPVSWAWPWG